MRCARCTSPGTHHEWLIHGRMVPITMPDGIPTSLCDPCWDVYVELKDIEDSLIIAGVSKQEINIFLKKHIRDMAEGRGPASG